MSEKQSTSIKKIISVLRKITKTVQLAPFIFAAVYTGIFALYNFASEDMLTILDMMFYISPIVIIAHLIYSRILELCIWHRIACLIPIIPQLMNLIDSYAIFSINGAILSNVAICLMLILFLVSAYKVFFCKDERE